MTQETHIRSKSSKIPLHLLLGIWGLYLFRFGYAYGFSDQDEFIPYLMHLLDASLFTQDWFVGTQLSSFSIRAYFVYLLLIPSKVFSIPIAVGLLYVASWFATASGIYVLALNLSKNRIAAIASVAIILVMTPFWTLGGNDLVHSMASIYNLRPFPAEVLIREDGSFTCIRTRQSPEDLIHTMFASYFDNGS